MREESEGPEGSDGECNCFCTDLLQTMGVSYLKWIHGLYYMILTITGLKNKTVECLNASHLM